MFIGPQTPPKNISGLQRLSRCKPERKVEKHDNYKYVAPNGAKSESASSLTPGSRQTNFYSAVAIFEPSPAAKRMASGGIQARNTFLAPDRS